MMTRKLLLAAAAVADEDSKNIHIPGPVAASGVVARLFPVHEWNEVENVDLRDINDDDAADQNGKSLALHRRIIASHRIGW